MALQPVAFAQATPGSPPVVLAQVETAASIPDWLFPVSSAIAIFGLGLAVWHASTREDYGFILAGIAWGYTLEQASIAGYETYSYNLDDFVLTLFDVPVDIALTWGGLLYAGWKTAAYLGLSRRRIPFFVGLFALHVDLAVDAIAIRVPFWTWRVGGAWYGVPLHNFWGWWTVSFLFVGCYFALGRWFDRVAVRLLLTPPSALVGFLVGITIWGTLAAIEPASEIVILTLLVAVSVVVVARSEFDPRPIPWPLAAIPLVVHGYFLAIGTWLGIFAEFPVLLAVALAMAGLSVALHLLPHRHRRRQAGRSTA